MLQIKWKIGAACPQHGDQSDDQFQRSRQGDGDHSFTPHAARRQRRGQRRRATVQLGVGQGPLAEGQGRGVRRRLHRRLQQGRQGRIRDRMGGGVEGLQLALGFFRRGDGNLAQRLGVECVRQKGCQTLPVGRGLLQRIEVRVGVHFQRQGRGGVAAEGEADVVHRARAQHLQRRVQPRKARRQVERQDVDQRPIQAPRAADQAQVAPQLLAAVTAVAAGLDQGPGGEDQLLVQRRVLVQRQAQRRDVHDHGGRARRGAAHPTHPRHADHGLFRAREATDIGRADGGQNVRPGQAPGVGASAQAGRDLRR
ncbi:hypothetical protein D3C72_577210 [compost metagenome]